MRWLCVLAKPNVPECAVGFFHMKHNISIKLGLGRRVACICTMPNIPLPIFLRQIKHFGHGNKPNGTEFFLCAAFPSSSQCSHKPTHLIVVAHSPHPVLPTYCAGKPTSPPNARLLLPTISNEIRQLKSPHRQEAPAPALWLEGRPVRAWPG